MRTDISPLPKRPRIPGFDYAEANCYFVTFITDNKQCTVSRIENFAVVLSPLGEITRDALTATLERYPHVKLHQSTFMPNHIHLLLEFQTPQNEKKKVKLPRVVNEIKGRSTVLYNKRRNMEGAPLWQYGYDERIIRSERHYFAVANYIINNPVKWAVDRLNPNYRQVS